MNLTVGRGRGNGANAAFDEAARIVVGTEKQTTHREDDERAKDD